MKIIIKDKEYNYEFNSVWGPLYTYEEMFGEKVPFNPAKRLCIHLMLYCILLRSNEGLDLMLEDFLSALNDLKLEENLRTYYFNRIIILTEGVKDDDNDKKKD